MELENSETSVQRSREMEKMADYPYKSSTF